MKKILILIVLTLCAAGLSACEPINPKESAAAVDLLILEAAQDFDPVKVAAAQTAYDGLSPAKQEIVGYASLLPLLTSLKLEVLLYRPMDILDIEMPDTYSFRHVPASVEALIGHYPNLADTPRLRELAAQAFAAGDVVMTVFAWVDERILHAYDIGLRWASDYIHVRPGWSAPKQWQDWSAQTAVLVIYVLSADVPFDVLFSPSAPAYYWSEPTVVEIEF